MRVSHEPYIPTMPHAKNMREVYLDAMEEMVKPFPAMKLPEWTSFNDVIGGFRSREFTILCGSTGAGKTTWLANVSAQLLKAGTKHFVMSVETGHTDFMKRVLSVLAGRDLNSGDAVSTETLARIHTKNSALLESDTIEFSLYDNRVKVEQLISDLRYMHDEKGCKVAMVDNLNFFMEVTRSADSVVEMDRVVHELVIFCKQVDMHVILVMHPGKGPGKSTRVESEFDIKGSSTAVQEATNVLLFNRPRIEDIDAGLRNSFQRELKISKLRRRGQFVGKTILYSSDNTRYREEGVV